MQDDTKSYWVPLQGIPGIPYCDFLFLFVAGGLIAGRGSTKLRCSWAKSVSQARARAKQKPVRAKETWIVS